MPVPIHQPGQQGGNKSPMLWFDGGTGRKFPQPRAGCSQIEELEGNGWWQPPWVELPPHTDLEESVYLPEEDTWKPAHGKGREDDDRPTGCDEGNNW